MKLFHQYFNVFGAEINAALCKLAIDKNEHYCHSKTSYSRHYPEWRQSKVIFDGQFTEFKKIIESEILKRLTEVLNALSMNRFLIDYFEVQLTSHNDGEFYKWHSDNSTPDSSTRTITFVYYFHSLPKKFSGGELIIYDADDRKNIVEPVNDSMVFFNSSTKHEVQRVICPSQLFEHGRFTLNGWIRRKKPLMTGSDFIGYNIFKNVPYSSKL